MFQHLYDYSESKMSFYPLSDKVEIKSESAPIEDTGLIYYDRDNISF